MNKRFGVVLLARTVLEEHRAQDTLLRPEGKLGEDSPVTQASLSISYVTLDELLSLLCDKARETRGRTTLLLL